MYIVAVMVTAVVFSITGLGVMSLALIVNLDTQQAVRNTELQVETESNANIALWKINSGEDTLGTYVDGDFSSVFDSTDMTLTVKQLSGDDSAGYILTLEEDYHFQRALASMNWIETYDYTLGEEPEHRPRENFDFLPRVDAAYWMSVADSVYHDNSRTFYDADLVEGILVFTGSGLNFENIDLENTTMVFTGNGTVDFRKDNTVEATVTDSTIFPALVFTDSTSYFFINEWFSFYGKDHIKGAIFSLGTIVLRVGDLTGPIVARNIVQWRNMDLDDGDHPEYYGWPEGFGEFNSYDWPKQIIQWDSF